MANEWLSQIGTINLSQMHINGENSVKVIKREKLSIIIIYIYYFNNSLKTFLSGLCNTSIDNPGKTDKLKLVQSILCFLETDTVLFYGELPFNPNMLGH